MSPQQTAANIEKLAERLKQNPNDVQGWQMLARSYLMQERFADAAGALEHLTSINPKDAGAWADYAEALALANGQNLAGKPTEAINRALQIDPNNQKALDLAAPLPIRPAIIRKPWSSGRSCSSFYQPVRKS
jgi:cytochrome c-type biogenesis protein CcmH